MAYVPRQKSTLRLVLEPLAIAVALACLVRAAVHLYSIPSASMLPSLQVGDHILVTRYWRSRPQPGDVVVFRAPGRAAELRIKRVVAVPGDLIDTTAGRVRIGGHALAEPYVLEQAATGEIAPQIVPADSLFVMGDNRKDSVDSRSWGPLPLDLVVGRARMILWSSSGRGGDAAVASTRSGRIRGLIGFRPGRIFKCIE